MRLDALCLLSDAQTFSATGVSTNTYDLGSTTPVRRVGDGEPIAVVIQIDQAADFTTGDETYSFEAIQSAAAALTTPTILAREAYIASGALITTLLVAGYIIVLPIPSGIPIQRFIGLNMTLAGTTPSLILTAAVTPLSSVGVRPQTYAKGYTIT